MPDMRLPGAEPPTGPPQITHTPGLSDALLKELAPLLAQDGIDIDKIEQLQSSDLPRLQAALDRAVERRNFELFNPVGPTRSTALTAIRDVVTAITNGDGDLAGQSMDQIVPEAPDNSQAEVSSCIGIALGLLDSWFGPPNPDPSFPKHPPLPAGHWFGEKAATDILALAAKGKASRSLQTLIINHGGHHMLAGSLLALAAAITANQQPTTHLIDNAIR
jgi:hypothetical protein